MRWLRQSTTVTVVMGPAVDATDGVTAETALSPTVYLSKNGGAQATRNSATAITHDRDGYYRVELNATDTGTLGHLRAQFSDGATHAPVWEEFMVLPAVVYDALVAGSDNLEVDVVQWLGTAPLALTSQLVQAQANQLGTQAKADVNAEADTALVDYDAVVPADLNDPTAAAIADAVWDEAKSGHVAAGSFGEEVQAHALSSEIPSAAAVADQVWDEATADHLGVGSMGENMGNLSSLDAAISSRSSHTAANIWSVGTRAITSVEAGAIAAASFGVGAVDAAALATDAVNEIADGILGRNIAGGSSSGRTVTSALRRIRNRVAVSGGTMTVYQEDDTASAWTAAVTTAAGDPISEVDPV